jgi:tRNA dimethylallyltransferase
MTRESNRRRALALVGPTGVGKTAIGIALAQRLGVEIISADSRQIYRLMDIGTAKPTHDEQEEVRHHLIDTIYPDQTYSAGTYVRDVQEVLRSVVNDHRTPIVVGGAGLYIRALMGGLFQAPNIPPHVREQIRLEMESNGTAAMHEHLSQVDPEAGGRIHPNDQQRIGRALEVYETTGTNLTEWQRTSMPESPVLDLQVVGVRRERTELYARTDLRVHDMIKAGLVEEVEGLLSQGYTKETPGLGTFGYKQIVDHLAGHISLSEAVADIQQQTRRYAKRQLTWFRHASPTQWLTLDHDSDPRSVCKEIAARFQPDKPV